MIQRKKNTLFVALFAGAGAVAGCSGGNGTSPITLGQPYENHPGDFEDPSPDSPRSGSTGTDRGEAAGGTGSVDTGSSGGAGSSGGNGSPGGNVTNPSPGSSGGAGSSGGSGSGELGPQCAALAACCARAQGEAASGCAQATKVISDGIKAGASASAYETQCKTAVDAYKTTICP